MTSDPIDSTTGSETEKIDVRLSHRIVRLFSEGLHASPNKAIEELVADSFDAGARRQTQIRSIQVSLTELRTTQVRHP